MPEATHILQAKCEKAAGEIWNAIRGRCPVTLIAFYADSEADGTGFCTTLDLDGLVETLEMLLARWREEPLAEKNQDAWLPDSDQLKTLTERCRDALPFSCHSALIFGSGNELLYGSFAPREDVHRMFATVTLPHFKAQQSLAQQPEGVT